jgi:MSHA biogenesis protein MshP
MRRQGGFGLVAAMFVIIVIALVIAAMVRLSTTQHGTNSLALQQARAYQAARAGLDWGISRAFNAGTCSNSAVSMAGGGLSDFTVSLTCSSTSYTDDDGSALRICRLTAQAQNGAVGSRPDYAYRRLSAEVVC